MNDLTQNIDKLHTTPMCAERIKLNLNLQTDDIVSWSKDAVRNADIIIGQGKNWYVYRDGVVVTVNAHSYTIITAIPELSFVLLSQLRHLDFRIIKRHTC